MNARGEMVDLATGEVVGRAEGAPLSQDPRTAGQDMPPEGLDRVKGLINNLSWGFNSALFAPYVSTFPLGHILYKLCLIVGIFSNFFKYLLFGRFYFNHFNMGTLIAIYILY